MTLRNIISIFPVILLALGLGITVAQTPGKIAHTIAVQPHVVQW